VQGIKAELVLSTLQPLRLRSTYLPCGLSLFKLQRKSPTRAPWTGSLQARAAISSRWNRVTGCFRAPGSGSPPFWALDCADESFLDPWVQAWVDSLLDREQCARQAAGTAAVV